MARTPGALTAPSDRILCAQLALAPALPAALAVPHLAGRADVRGMQAACEQIGGALREMKALLPQMHARVDKAEFYMLYRHLLNGFPHGLRLPALGPHEPSLEPVRPARATAADADARGEVVVTYAGLSAGQTALIMIVDLALGVRHGPRIASFQREMRAYMPACHRELLERLEIELTESGSLRDAALASGATAELRAAHVAAVTALAAVRAMHLGVATHYLSAALKGTGGSDFRVLLDEALHSTRMAASATAD